jgi:hypothetical protein
LVDTFLGFALNSSEELLADICHFSKEVGKVWEMYQPIGRKGLKFIRE